MNNAVTQALQHAIHILQANADRLRPVLDIPIDRMQDSEADAELARTTAARYLDLIEAITTLQAVYDVEKKCTMPLVDD